MLLQSIWINNSCIIFSLSFQKLLGSLLPKAQLWYAAKCVSCKMFILQNVHPALAPSFPGFPCFSVCCSAHCLYVGICYLLAAEC